MNNKKSRDFIFMKIYSVEKQNMNNYLIFKIIHRIIKKNNPQTKQTWMKMEILFLNMMNQTLFNMMILIKYQESWQILLELWIKIFF